MKTRTIFQIAVLANDVGPDGRTLGIGTKARCDCALRQIRQWLCQSPYASPYQTVIIYTAAGNGGKWRGPTTIAVAMEEYLKVGLGAESSRCGFVTNTDEERVWSTLAEMKWIFSQIDEQRSSVFPYLTTYDPIRFVTNLTHSRRVELIRHYFHPNELIGEFLVSGEAPPHFLHEWCAYAKLVLHYVGLGWFFEPLRRRYYGG